MKSKGLDFEPPEGFEFETDRDFGKGEFSFRGVETVKKLDKIRQIDAFTEGCLDFENHASLERLLRIRTHEVLHITAEPKGTVGWIQARQKIILDEADQGWVTARISASMRSYFDPSIHTPIAEIRTAIAPARKLGIKELLKPGASNDRKHIANGIKRLLTFDW